MLDFDPALARERDESGYLPLHHAVDGMSTKFCKALIKAYPESIRIESNSGSLPIHEACANLDRDDLVDTIQHLLELYPESINARDERGRLPFHYAASKARRGRIDIMKLLLKHDPDAASKKTTDGKGQLPLHLACRICKRPEAIQVLYDAFPEAIVVLDGDRKILMQLVKKGRSKVFKFFHDQFEYIKHLNDMTFMITSNEIGWLPLHRALKDNVSLGTIKLMVKKCPAAVRMADDVLTFPIHIACKFSSVQVVKFLVEYDGIPMGQLDTNKDSVLHYACRGGNLDVVKYLLDKYASLVSSAEVNGNSELPIHLLCEAGKSKVDCDSAEYIETIWLMLLSNPEAVMS